MRLFCIVLLLLAATNAHAGWSPTLSARPNLPPQFMVVDKTQQRAFFVRSASEGQTLDAYHTMPCTTGMRDGDKEAENDRKTPEGVYFLDGKRTSGLDFSKFGNTAYPLNYPNPVDRIQGKTGNGILIHGRGGGFSSRQTLGCIVLDNAEVDRLDATVRIHATPVIVGERLLWGKGSRVGIPPEVAMGAWAWARSQEKKDSAFFHLFDPSLYEKSTGVSFARFKEKTLADFRKDGWTDIRMGKPQVLEGPGYFVCSFAQTTMPDRTEEGLRRLYWMRRGEFWKIVGEEWVPQSQGIAQNYAQIVEKEIRALLQDAHQAWAGRNLDIVAKLYDLDAQRGSVRGKQNIVQALKKELEAGEVNPFSGTPRVTITSKGVEVDIAAGSSRHSLVFRPGNFDTWSIMTEDAR